MQDEDNPPVPAPAAPASAAKPVPKVVAVPSSGSATRGRPTASMWVIPSLAVGRHSVQQESHSSGASWGLATVSARSLRSAGATCCVASVCAVMRMHKASSLNARLKCVSRAASQRGVV